MPTYIGLIKFTDQGIKSVKETVHRREAIRKAAGAMGVKFTAYLTLGRYDYVAVIDAPNDEAAAQFALATGMQGNLSTETLRAFTEDEVEKLVGSLP